MAHSLAWVWCTLGTTVAFAISCSSTDAAKTPSGVMPDIGGDAAGGATPGSAGGGVIDEGGASVTLGSSGADNGGQGQGTGGDASSAMTDGWLSGTRLHAVLQVAGGSRLFKSWHDTELDLDCAFGKDAEGTERCLPRDLNGEVTYSDAKCTKLVALVNSSRPATTWVPAPRANTCDSGQSFVTVGAAVSVTDIYSNASGDCLPAGTVGGTFVTKAVGAPVAASTFVAVTKSVRETRDARLSANVRVAADGSREVTSQFDLVRQANCRPREHAREARACVPVDLAYLESLYANATCDVQAAYRPDYGDERCGKAPDIIEDNQPWFTDSYFEVGKDVTGAVYSKQPTCMPYAAAFVYGPQSTFFAVGKPVAWSSLAQLSSKNEGPSRIQLVVTRGSGDELITREAFFDSTLDVVCNEALTSDLKTRCAPYAPFQVDFADAQCTQGLFQLEAGSTPPVQAAFGQSRATGGGATFFKRGAKIARPTKIWELSSSGCVESSPSAGTDLYATTTIPPAEMVLLTTETE